VFVELQWGRSTRAPENAEPEESESTPSRSFNGAGARGLRKMLRNCRHYARLSWLQWGRSTRAPENDGCWRSVGSWYSGFNGAGARGPRKIPPSPRPPSSWRSFNGAGARGLRKIQQGVRRGSRFQSFNGAGARGLRKMSAKKSCMAQPDRLQWGRSTRAPENGEGEIICSTTPSASMGPEHEGSGKW